MYKSKELATVGLLSWTILLLGCESTASSVVTNAERLSGYTYIPVDPFSVTETLHCSCVVDDRLKESKGAQLLKSLPDNAVRTTLETFYADGSVTYGPAVISGKATSYRMTVDYINADTTNVDIWIKREAKLKSTGTYESINIFQTSQDVLQKYEAGTQRYSIIKVDKAVDSSGSCNDELDAKGSEWIGKLLTNKEADRELVEEGYTYVSLPIYVGIGLRATADISDTKAGANISGLGAIGISADNETLRGSLTVQTLGVNGQSIAAALPIQSELNRTTAQNAITSVASIKALLYEQDTVVQPRVVGIYLPFPASKALVNSIISQLAQSSVNWEQKCYSSRVGDAQPV